MKEKKKVKISFLQFLAVNCLYKKKRRRERLETYRYRRIRLVGTSSTKIFLHAIFGRSLSARSPFPTILLPLPRSKFSSSPGRSRHFLPRSSSLRNRVTSRVSRAWFHAQKSIDRPRPRPPRRRRCYCCCYRCWCCCCYPWTNRRGIILIRSCRCCQLRVLSVSLCGFYHAEDDWSGQDRTTPS